MLVAAVALLIVGLAGEVYFISTGSVTIGPGLVPVVFGIALLLLTILWSWMVLRKPTEN